jgi:nicotinate-nucleotide pyrophosphorylase (carboxylating)
LNFSPIDSINVRLLDDVLLAALREDVGSGDITSRSTVSSAASAAARFVPKEDIVLAGLPVLERLGQLVDSSLEYRAFAQDGEAIETGKAFAQIRGHARSILVAERVTLNLLQRMCGIATLTRRFVEQVKGTKARVVDTRKTVPGLRILDKYAVTCGGGLNHRMGLYDCRNPTRLQRRSNQAQM